MPIEPVLRGPLSLVSQWRGNGTGSGSASSFRAGTSGSSSFQHANGGRRRGSGSGMLQWPLGYDRWSGSGSRRCTLQRGPWSQAQVEMGSARVWLIAIMFGWRNERPNSLRQ